MSATLRFNWFLLTYGRLAVLAFVLVGLATVGAGGYVYTNPPSAEVSEQAEIEDVSTSILTSAVVVNNTTLYTPGERLVNQPVYVAEATPNLTFHIQTRVPNGSTVTVSQHLTIRIAASRDGNVFWESTRVIVGDRQTVSDGQAFSSATVNMSDIAHDVRTRRNQVGDIGEFTSEVVLNVTYDTGRYDGELTGATPVVFTEQAYWVDDDIARSQTHSQTVTRQVTQPPDTSTAFTLGALGVLFIATAGTIEGLRRRDIDRGDLEMQLALVRYDEWISEGQIVTDPDRKYVTISSLQDLVDIAIDSEKRVIHDPEFDIYAVVDDDLVYYFASADLRLDDWLTM